MISQQEVRAIYNEERKRIWDAQRGTSNPRDIEIDAMCALIARVMNEYAPIAGQDGATFETDASIDGDGSALNPLSASKALEAAIAAHVAERHTRGKKTGAA